MRHPSLISSSIRRGDSLPQDRNSPEYLLGPGRRVAGGRFDLDAASNRASTVDAAHECYLDRGVASPVVIHSLSRLDVPPHDPRFRVRWRGDGLALAWPNFLRIFCNPPWEHCGLWIAAAAAAAASHRKRADGRQWSIQLLCPLRPHRGYWGPAYSADAWCLLRPVRFQGFINQMPTPCVWLYWGSDVKLFQDVFHGDLGAVLTSLPAPAILRDMTASGQEQIEHSLLCELLSIHSPVDVAKALRRAARGMSLLELSQLPDMVAGNGIFAGAEYRRGECPGSLIDGVNLVLAEARVGSGDSTPVTSSEKAASKKVASKKASKKDLLAPPRIDSKGAASKKAASKKAASKGAASKKAASKGAASKKAASKKASRKPSQISLPVISLHDDSPAAFGQDVHRHDMPGMEGKIVGFVPNTESVQVLWTGQGAAVNVVAKDLLAVGGAKMGKAARLDEEVMSFFAGRTEPVGCGDVQTAIGKSASTALRSLKRLVEGGRITLTGSGKTKMYERAA